MTRVFHRPGAWIAPLALASVAAAIWAVALSAQRPSPAAGSGFSASELDASVRPQDNLYQFVNGRWLDATPMPDDRVSHNAATELVEKTNLDMRRIIEEISARPDRRPGSPAQQVADLYASMMDEAALEARGLAPLEPELRAIDAIDSIRALAERAGRLSASTTAGPFQGSVNVDPRRLTDAVAHVSQGGLLLERERYVNDDELSRRIRGEYVRYLERVFRIAGRADAAGDARAVLALEIEIAATHVPAVEVRNSQYASPAMSLQQMNAAFPGFDWVAWGKPQGMDKVNVLVLHTPFFKAFSALVPKRPLSTWRAWLAGRYLTAMAPYANQALNAARFDFFGKILTGQQTPIVRWKRGVGLVNRLLGDIVGKSYVLRHFPKTSRTRVERIVEQIVRAYSRTISEQDWMHPGTRGEAQSKLGLLKTRVGYPETWGDYRGLEIRADDLFGNLARAQAFDGTRRMARMVRPDGRGEWVITGPQSVNAYYVPARNEIMLPAAVLQPPYFDASADEAVNYGAIGAVIGHEITHGLDGTGRYYDGNGESRDWWKAQDERGFVARAQILLNDLSRYPPIDGERLNGNLAIAESVSDLIGLSVAYRAYRASLDGRPPPVIDGWTGDQRFFLSWARIWRSRERPEYRRQLLLFSRYAPGDYRANGTAAHLEAFYRAFDVGPADKLYLAPEKRARIY